jgi:hypothetical protein
MREIFLEKTEKFINIKHINKHKPIFVKKDGKLTGMVVNEDGKGWITRLGGGNGSSGHYETLESCIKKGMEFGYTYHQ